MNSPQQLGCGWISIYAQHDERSRLAFDRVEYRPIRVHFMGIVAEWVSKSHDMGRQFVN